MSSSNAPVRAAPLLPRLAAAGLVLALLGGCGFEPLYARRDDAAAAGELASIKVARIDDRAGQHLRNLLLDRLNPGGAPNKGQYTLTVTMGESRQDLAIRRDETATRANLLISASYELYEVATGRALFRATSTVTTSFNIVRSDFATISAENDARRRGAREISDDIRTRLAVYFNRRRKGGT